MARALRSGGASSGARFDRSLLLVRWLTDLLGGRYGDLLTRVKESPDTGSPGNSARLMAVLSRSGVQVPVNELERAERGFMGDWTGIATARQAATGMAWRLTHFQWLAALFVEIYLAKLAAPGGRAAMVAALNEARRTHYPHLSAVVGGELNHLALWMATGSGKTLMMHLNTRQFMRHAQGILGGSPQRVLLLTPSEVLSRQHTEEFARSGIDDITLGRTLEITELTKLYLPIDSNGDPVRVKAGVSVATDQYAGPNLLLVDEGHKGKSTDRDESAWRERRQALVGLHATCPVEGAPGFEFEYSATFAQIAEADRGFFNEYARCTVFDYGYRRFHDDGFGKSPKSLITQDSHGQDLVLAAALIAFWRQCAYWKADGSRAARYRMAPPLAAWVGQTVTGKSQDVVQALVFLVRFAGDAAFARGLLKQVLSTSSPLQAALFSAQLDLATEREMGEAALHTAICTELFGGSGALAVRALSKDELGIHLPGAESERWCGTAYVGDALKLAEELRNKGVTVEDADSVTGSLFARLDSSPEIKFLIGSRKFIEGWSSFRVSTLGLLQIGKNAGTQVIQLFGRGVRLTGVGGQLKRAAFVPQFGPHPADIEVTETLYVFGVKADYVQTWLEALSREGMPLQSEVLPVTLRGDVNTLALKVPVHDAAREAAFRRDVVSFAAIAAQPVLIDLTPRLTLQEGTGAAQTLATDGQHFPVRAVLSSVMNVGEHLFQFGLRFRRQNDLQQLWVRSSDISHWLDGVQVCVSASQLPLSRESVGRVIAELEGHWAAAQLRAHRRARQQFLTAQPSEEFLSNAHANFPMQRDAQGNQAPGYRIEAMVASDLVNDALATLELVLAKGRVAPAGWDQIKAALRDAVGELNLASTLQRVQALIAANADADELTPPLPRLYIPQHMYAPLLLAAPAAAVEHTQQLSLLDEQPVTLKISPPPLEESEARFVWDLRRVWERLLATSAAEWAYIEVVALRNLSGVGVGLFAADGFYPDFLLWLKRGTGENAKQVLAFIEPKGLRLQWPQDKLDLLQNVVPSWQFSVPVRGFMVTGTSAAEIAKIRPGFTWASGPDVLLQQDANGDYVEAILRKLASLL